MSRLIVYAGPNGGGKSTLRDIGAEKDAVDVVIDPDRIARFLSPDHPESSQVKAGRTALQLFHDSMAQGKAISLESTLTGQTVLNRMAEAKAVGYEVDLRYVALQTAQYHVDRVQMRVARGGHDIPPETIIRRYRRSLDNLPEAIRIADRSIVMDNTDNIRRVLLHIVDGQIVRQAADLPAWLEEQTPSICRLLAG